MTMLRPLVGFLAAAFLTLTALAADEHAPDYRDGSLAKNEPQAVYAADPSDSWNQIFYCLFTRSIQTRLSNDFKEAESFERAAVMGSSRRQVSKRSFERIESGDRAIEPLYPTFFSNTPLRVLADAPYSQLKKALESALEEEHARPALNRALMQCDVWAAHDLLSRNYSFKGEDGQQRLERRDQLLKLLARFVKKLALTEEEIKSLPDNYAAGVRADHLPDLFAASSAWLEIRWFDEREHDSTADFRRVARVFIKPVAAPKDKVEFLNGLRQAERLNDQVESVALVTQNLLINSDGKVVASPLTYEVQTRSFAKGSAGIRPRVVATQSELSRRRIVAAPKSDGFEEANDQAPAYLPSAGNDYSFASDTHSAGITQPILVRLNQRCAACHAGSGQLMTFNRHNVDPLPPVAVLKPTDNEHARYVIGRKTAREDFKSLVEQWAE